MMNLDLNKLESLFEGGRFLTYKKKETIIRAEDVPSGVYYVKKGYVREYSVDKYGKEFSLIVFMPGDFFPVLWSLGNIPNSYYIEALTRVEVMRLPKGDFLRMLQKDQALFLEIIKKIVVRFSGLMQRSEYLVFGNAYEKVASILVILAERFGNKNKESIEIPFPVTHKDIGHMVGMTRETTSIELLKLEKKGAISYKGKKMTIINPQLLKKESLLD